MRFIYFALFILLTPIFSFASSTTTVEVSFDAYVNEINQVRNYGSSQDMFVQSGPSRNKRALIYFNFPNFPTYTEIEKAEVKIYANEIPNPTRTYGIYSLSSSFVEGNGGEDNNPLDEVRWDNKPESVFISSTTTPDVKNNFMFFDVTSFVSNVYSGNLQNFGFEVSDLSENSDSDTYTNFRPKEYATISRRPKMDIKYKLPVNTISGKVFEDLDKDSFFDLEDIGLSNVLVSISGKVSTTTSTISDGSFSFQNLPNGSYDVCIEVQSNQIQLSPLLNSNCSSRSSFNLILDDNATTSYIADFSVFTDKTSPSIPNFISPINEVILNNPTTTFSWDQVEDPSLPVSYIFSYSNENSTTTLNAFVNPIYISTTTENIIELNLNNGDYFFNIRSCDVFMNCSDFSDPRYVRVSTTSAVKDEKKEDLQKDIVPQVNQVVISNGPISGISGSFVLAPSIPENVPKGIENKASSEVISNTLPYIPNNNSNDVTSNNLNSNPAYPVVPRNDIASSLDKKENALNQETSKDLVEESFEQNNNDFQSSQLASVSESGKKLDWKLSIILVIILVLGGFYFLPRIIKK